MRKIAAIFTFIAFTAQFSVAVAATGAVAASCIDDTASRIGAAAGATVADVGTDEFFHVIALSHTAASSLAATFRSAALFYTDDAACISRADGAGNSSRADETVARMSAAVKALGGYAVAFSVRAGGYVAQGDYAVVGDGYHLSLGDVEVFCDGKVRREVNRAVREITIDAVDTSSRNILNNPARGFDFLGDGFRAELLAEGGGEITVRLTPVNRAADGKTPDVGMADGIIYVTVGAGDWLPRKLSYRLGGDTVAIDILHIASSSAPLPSFEPSAFSGFEIIDFR